MAIKDIKKGKLTWTNIDRIDDEALEYLKKNHKFHHLDLEDVQSETQTPKIDVYKDYLFLVLHFPQWGEAGHKITSHEVDVFVGKNFLITIQHTKNKEIKNFFYRCMNNRKVSQEWLSQGSGFLLYKLTEALFHQSRPMLNRIGKQISVIEHDIFSGEQDVKDLQQLAMHRRNVLHFRRVIDPQRYLMSNLSHIRKPYLNEDLSLYFDDLRDYLDKLWAIVDTYKDTIAGLHLTVESIITQRTNKIITVLTVMSAALLPLTLLAGIYGMNISLPFSGSPVAVWSMFFLVILVLFFAFVFMRRNRWL